MADKEKVIRGLTVCTDNTPVEDCRKCPYQGKEYCTDALMQDALVLLRRGQEPVKPETVVQTGIGENPTIQALVCGNCHKIMSGIVFDYCPWCGRGVKWNPYAREVSEDE